MKKHFALLVSAFVLALCSYADAWANTHVVAPQKGNSIQSVVVPAQDLASVTFFEFNPVLETWSALSVTSNVPGQEAITSVVVLTADKTPAWNTIQPLGTVTSVAAPVNRTWLVASVVRLGLAFAAPPTTGPLGPDNPVAAGECLGKHWAETCRVLA